MIPTFFIYLIAGLIAFIILSMVILNTVGGNCNGGQSVRNNYLDNYDPFSSNARMYTLPPGVKAT